MKIYHELDPSFSNPKIQNPPKENTLKSVKIPPEGAQHPFFELERIPSKFEPLFNIWNQPRKDFSPFFSTENIQKRKSKRNWIHFLFNHPQNSNLPRYKILKSIMNSPKEPALTFFFRTLFFPIGINFKNLLKEQHQPSPTRIPPMPLNSNQANTTILLSHKLMPRKDN